MLIDKSYFTGKDRFIPNLTDANRVAALNDFIAKRTERFLKTLFGLPLYVEYKAGIAVVEPDTIAEHWLFLKNHVDLKEALANYVYYWWMRKDRTKTTAEGELRPEVENGTIVFSNEKMIDCWNQIWPLIQPFAVEMDTLQTTYTTWPYGYGYFLFQEFRPINDFGI